MTLSLLRRQPFLRGYNPLAYQICRAHGSPTAQFYSSSEAPGTSVDGSNSATLPKEFTLQQNYPNPFNPTTTISYSVNTTGNIELAVYDLQGHQVATLVNGVQPVGNYQVVFDAQELPSGVYVYTLRSAESVLTNKMVLMK